MKNNYKILSVGGSIIIPKTGFDVEFLKKFRQMIIDEVNAGQKFVLVIGGGNTCRLYQAAAKEVANLSDKDLDWLGIYATHFNAEFVRLFFGDLAYREVVKNPIKRVWTNKPVIVAGGYLPGCSTDKDAVLFAKNFGAKEVLNLSNVDYIYDSDPNKNPTAKKLENISWTELLKLVGDRWSPGANVPFDPEAAKLAAKLKLRVGFVKGTGLVGLKNALSGRKFEGSVIG